MSADDAMSADDGGKEGIMPGRSAADKKERGTDAVRMARGDEEAAGVKPLLHGAPDRQVSPAVRYCDPVPHARPAAPMAGIFRLGPVRAEVVAFLTASEAMQLAHASTALRRSVLSVVPAGLQGWASLSTRRDGVVAYLPHEVADGPAEGRALAGMKALCILESRALRGVLSPAPVREYAVPPPPAPLPPMRVGDTFDVLDTVNRWYEGSAVETSHDGMRVKVAYHHWNAKWDEWVDLRAPHACARIAQKGTQAPTSDPGWSPLRRSDTVLVYCPDVCEALLQRQPTATGLSQILRAVFPTAAAAAGGRLRWVLRDPGQTASYVESRFVNRSAFNAYFCGAGYTSDRIDYERNGVSLSEKILVQVGRECLVAVHRVGPRGAPGYSPQHFWNMPSIP